MKAVVAAFNQEKALVGAFSVITNLRMQFGCNFLKHYLELQRGLLVRLAAGLRQEDEHEDEAEHTDAAVQEEGGGQAELLLQVLERLGDDEPAEVGGQVGDGVGVATGPADI